MPVEINSWDQLTTNDLEWRRLELEYDVNKGHRNAETFKEWIAEIDAELESRKQSK